MKYDATAPFCFATVHKFEYGIQRVNCFICQRVLIFFDRACNSQIGRASCRERVSSPV